MDKDMEKEKNIIVSLKFHQKEYMMNIFQTGKYGKE